jgi:hypothetical protein
VDGIGEIISCRNCGIPLARVKGNKVYVHTFYKGKGSYVVIEFRYSGSGVLSIDCKSCKGIKTPYQMVTLVAPKVMHKSKLTKRTRKVKSQSK